MNNIEVALAVVGKAAFEAGLKNKQIQPGELVQVVVRREELGGFDKLRREWLKDTARENWENGRRQRLSEGGSL